MARPTGERTRSRFASGRNDVPYSRRRTTAARVAGIDSAINPLQLLSAVTRYRNLLLYLLLAAIWGTAFPVTKAGLEFIPPVTFAALRFDIAAVVMFAFVLARKERLHPTTRDDYIYIVVGGLFIIGAHHAFLFAGQQYVPSAVASVLLGLIPVITPTLTRLTASDEPLTKLGVFGVGVGFLGVAVIANPDPANLLADIRGVLLLFGAALTFAIGAVVTHGSKPELSTLALQPWMMLVGAVSLHVATLGMVGEGSAFVVVTPTAGWSVLYLALVAGALGFTLYFVLLRRLGPIEMSFIEYVLPLFAAITGWLLLAEGIAPNTVLGFLLILAGFVCVKRRAIRAELRRNAR